MTRGNKDQDSEWNVRRGSVQRSSKMQRAIPRPAAWHRCCRRSANLRIQNRVARKRPSFHVFGRVSVVPGSSYGIAPGRCLDLCCRRQGRRNGCSMLAASRSTGAPRLARIGRRRPGLTWHKRFARTCLHRSAQSPARAWRRSRAHSGNPRSRGFDKLTLARCDHLLCRKFLCRPLVPRYDSTSRSIVDLCSMRARRALLFRSFTAPFAFEVAQPMPAPEAVSPFDPSRPAMPSKGHWPNVWGCRTAR